MIFPAVVRWIIIGSALLTSALAQAPSNDLFVNATPLTSFPASLAGTTLDATAEIGEPNHTNSLFGNIASNSVWYSWTPTSRQTLSVSVTRDNYNIILAAHRGTAFDAPLVEVGAADFFFNGDESLTFTGVAGETYYIAVDGGSQDGTIGQAGAFQISFEIIPAPANDAFADATEIPPTFPAQAQGTTTAATPEVGEPNHDPFDNVASNSVWYRWTASEARTVAVSIQGTENDLVLAIYEDSSDLTDLTLIKSQDDQGTGARESAILEVASGETLLIAVDSFSVDSFPSTTTGPFTLRIDPLPENDNFANATPISGNLPISLSGSSIGATIETDEPEHNDGTFANLSSNSVWYTFTPETSGNYRIQTANNDLNEALVIYTGESVDALTLVAASNTNGLGVGPDFTTSETITIVATAGTTYRIAIDPIDDEMFATTSGLFDLRIFPEVPNNNNFADAALLIDTRLGTTEFATPEVGEPNHTASLGASNIAANSVWYRWAAPTSGEAEITVLGILATDYVFSVYTGTELDNLTLIADADFFNQQGEQASFSAIAGETYSIAIQGFSSNGTEQTTGSFDIAISQETGNLSTYDQWIAGFPSLTGSNALPTANPTSDGIPNLLKLAFGLNPTLPLSQDPARANAPTFTIEGSTPTLSATIASGLGTIQVTVESSQDLSTWTTISTLNSGPVAISIAPREDRPRSFTRIRAAIVE